MVNSLEKKIELAADKLGGRLKLTAILIHRIRDLRQAGLKQDKAFYALMEPMLDEILDDRLTVAGEETKTKKK
ncbi:MAG: hypothetical protein HZA49_09480 [Planctomycetes bacterium]|nr:hypothetical protein [Planctomycetota bacterium]